MPSADLLQVQQSEILADWKAVLVAQEVAADGEGEASFWKRQEALDPLRCNLEVADL